MLSFLSVSALLVDLVSRSEDWMHEALEEMLQRTDGLVPSQGRLLLLLNNPLKMAS